MGDHSEGYKLSSYTESSSDKYEARGTFAEYSATVSMC